MGWPGRGPDAEDLIALAFYAWQVLGLMARRGQEMVWRAMIAGSHLSQPEVRIG
jgi:hypothetical protein